MKLSPLARDLYDAISELPVIDAHEHLPSEADYLTFQYSGLNLFAGYVWHDLESAGLSPAFKATMRDGGYRSVDEWWPTIKPYWEQVCHGSYARALRITARDLFGLEEVSDATIHELAEHVIADNTPGLYRRILQERCGIWRSITCVEQVAFPHDPGLCGVSMIIWRLLDSPLTVGESGLAERAGEAIYSLDGAAAAMQTLARRDLQSGAVGFKLMVADYYPPDARAAEAAFEEALHSPKPVKAFPAVRDYLLDKCLDVAAEADVPVAVHTGYWGDFRQLDPKNLLGIALHRRDVRFDLFHLGMPMIRDAQLIGKVCPNVTLNLTWCPIISQVQTCRALDELIDLVPASKTIAFGGDYRTCVQKAWGHLVMARECVAMALANRIDSGDFDWEESIRLARMWFYENPARVYRLK